MQDCAITDEGCAHLEMALSGSLAPRLQMLLMGANLGLSAATRDRMRGAVARRHEFNLYIQSGQDDALSVQHTESSGTRVPSHTEPMVSRPP